MGGVPNRFLRAVVRLRGAVAVRDLVLTGYAPGRAAATARPTVTHGGGSPRRARGLGRERRASGRAIRGSWLTECATFP